MRLLKNIIGATADLEGHKEMKTRIISAAVLVPILFVVVLALDEIVAAVLMALIHIEYMIGRRADAFVPLCQEQQKKRIQAYCRNHTNGEKPGEYPGNPWR